MCESSWVIWSASACRSINQSTRPAQVSPQERAHFDQPKHSISRTSQGRPKMIHRQFLDLISFRRAILTIRISPEDSACAGCPNMVEAQIDLPNMSLFIPCIE